MGGAGLGYNEWVGLGLDVQVRKHCGTGLDAEAGWGWAGMWRLGGPGLRWKLGGAGWGWARMWRLGEAAPGCGDWVGPGAWLE